MASIPCPITQRFSSSSASSTATVKCSFRSLKSPFLAGRGKLGWCRESKLMRTKMCPSGTKGGGARCWFKFGKNGVDAEGAGIYGSQTRDDFDRDDVEQYFNYMGMLAVEGSYDKLNALLDQNIHPVDILLLLAATEGDKPKMEELLRAGAKYDVKDADGRTALDRAATQEIREFIVGYSAQNVR